MTEEMRMWLQLLIHLLPMVPTLVADVEGAVDKLKNDPNAEAKAQQAQKAIADIGAMIGEVLRQLPTK